jgi:hypothetical protein
MIDRFRTNEGRYGAAWAHYMETGSVLPGMEGFNFQTGDPEQDTRNTASRTAWFVARGIKTKSGQQFTSSTAWNSAMVLRKGSDELIERLDDPHDAKATPISAHALARDAQLFSRSASLKHTHKWHSLAPDFEHRILDTLAPKGTKRDWKGLYLASGRLHPDIRSPTPPSGKSAGTSTALLPIPKGNALAALARTSTPSPSNERVPSRDQSVPLLPEEDEPDGSGWVYLVDTDGSRAKGFIKAGGTSYTVDQRLASAVTFLYEPIYRIDEIKVVDWRRAEAHVHAILDRLGRHYRPDCTLTGSEWFIVSHEEARRVLKTVEDLYRA